jgi:hypothetical protein
LTFEFLSDWVNAHPIVCRVACTQLQLPCHAEIRRTGSIRRTQSKKFVLDAPHRIHSA